MKKTSSRNAMFFLLGLFIYSILFWLTRHNHAQVFGMIVTALVSLLLYKITYHPSAAKEKFKTRDILFAAGGAIFDSLLGGFPFNYLGYFYY
jgi:multisubunit Na+/H+ antiporter MnhE subunit